MSRVRRNFTGAKKMAILREHLIEQVAISQVCEQHGIQPTVFYTWQKKLFEEGGAIFEAKQHLGFESTRGWCSKTVNRQAPLAMLLLTLVKAWYASCARNEPALQPQTAPWYGRKNRPSFLDMLSALRRMFWQHRIIGKSAPSGRVQKMINAVSYALCAAA